MQIESRIFGTIQVDESQAVKLTEPMPGFGDLRRFAVLDAHPESPLKWFQSLDRAEVCFLIADPHEFFPGFSIELPTARLADLEIEAPNEAVVAVILTAGADVTQTTANLLAPLIFNSRRGLARQVILEGSGYPIRARLFEETQQAAEA